MRNKLFLDEDLFYSKQAYIFIIIFRFDHVNIPDFCKATQYSYNRHFAPKIESLEKEIEKNENQVFILNENYDKIKESTEKILRNAYKMYNNMQIMVEFDNEIVLSGKIIC